MIVITITVLTNSKIVIETVLYSIEMWKNNIFPSLFPFFIISNLLIEFNFVEISGKLFNPLMKLFKVNKNGSFVFLMSLISGFPSNAKYGLELLNKNLISKNDLMKLLTFTNFGNPLFILGTISIQFLNNKYLGFVVLIAHYLSNIITGLIFRNKYISKNDFKQIEKKKISNFGSIITNSIFSSINTLVLILGIITTCLILTTLISNVFNFNQVFNSILYGIFELTQGLKHISLLNIDINLKAIIMSMILSFGGLSVHLQVFSILNEFKYSSYLFARIIQSIISGIICFIIIYIL